MAQQPMYQQIAEDLRKQIDSGLLGRGSQLPTELELREQYDASRNTIRDAIKRLTGQGLVETRPGQGTFVTMKVDPFVTVLTADPKVGFGGGEGATYLSQVSAEHRKPSATTPKVEVQTPLAVITRRLRVPPNAQVVSRHQERYIDDVPWSLQTSFYPMEFITRGATRLLMAEDIADGDRALPGRHHRAQADRLPGLDYRPETGRQRAEVLRDLARLHGVRDLPHGLRPEQEADAGNGDSLPRRPEPVHRRRRR